MPRDRHAAAATCDRVMLRRPRLKQVIDGQAATERRNELGRSVVRRSGWRGLNALLVFHLAPQRGATALALDPYCGVVSADVQKCPDPGRAVCGVEPNGCKQAAAGLAIASQGRAAADDT